MGGRWNEISQALEHPFQVGPARPALAQTNFPLFPAGCSHWHLLQRSETAGHGSRQEGQDKTERRSQVTQVDTFQLQRSQSRPFRGQSQCDTKYRALHSWWLRYLYLISRLLHKNENKIKLILQSLLWWNSLWVAMWITKRNLRQTDYSRIIILDHYGLFSFHGNNQRKQWLIYEMQTIFNQKWNKSKLSLRRRKWMITFKL